MRVFLGVTGASGAAYAARALEALTRAGCEVGLCISGSGLVVISHELLGTGAGANPERERITSLFLERHATGDGRVSVLDLDELTSPFASGSSSEAGALICPCSGSTLGSIAGGTGRNLIHRAADVMLKERRRLVLVTRETPLNLIHIENMATVVRAGAVVMPAMPGFYNDPQSIEDLVDFVVGKALDQLGVAHDLLRRWGEDER
jgi:4-hydroxy-3-polyprenylbenzoate decarboxylase